VLFKGVHISKGELLVTMPKPLASLCYYR